MKNTLSESTVEYLLTSGNAPEEFPGKDFIWQRLEQGQRAGRRFSRRTVMRFAAVTAAVFTLMVTSGFANEITAVIRHLRNGAFTYFAKNKVEFKDGGQITAQILIEGDEGWLKSKKRIGDLGGYRRFEVLEDAQRVLSFQLRELGTPPEGMKYSHTRVLQAEDGTYLGDASVMYEDIKPNDHGFVGFFSLSQRYVGPNASIEITADYTQGGQPPTAVTVNGNEGIYVTSA
jgi:hypothetical protein